MARASAVALAAMALGGGVMGLACKNARHARIASFVPPPVPAGFTYQNGSGWRVAVPSTWKTATEKDAAAWVVSDPQAVDDFEASVNVVTEPFAGESYDYARASEVAVRGDPRATVESSRDDAVDGDPTLILESRWAQSGPSGVPYRIMQAALASRGTGYVVTCAVSATAAGRYHSTCDSIIHSFAVER